LNGAKAEHCFTEASHVMIAGVGNTRI
jgi:hypothetical protein